MSSSPSTPLSNRREFLHEPPTRIPQPSPQLRRSFSLRLRSSNGDDCYGSGGDFDMPTTTSTTTTTPTAADKLSHVTTVTSTKARAAITTSPSSSNSPLYLTLDDRKRHNVATQVGKELKNSKSCQFISNMTTHSFGNGAKKDNGTIDSTTTKAAAEISQSTDKNNTSAGVPVSPPKKENCLNNCNSIDEHDLALHFTSTPNSHKLNNLPSHHRNCRTSTNVSAKSSPISPVNGYLDDDLDSLYSFASVASGRSTMSGGCDHPHVARNGTTFSGRRMKYVVHCSSYAGQTGEEYLTPTQRAQKHIRRLKELLAQARHDLEQKDSEILRLTKEVVELRLFKASLNSPEERSNSSDAVTVRENNDMKTSQDVSPIADMTDQGLKMISQNELCSSTICLNPLLEKMCNSEMQSSFSDSGHFEDMTTSSINSKDSFVQTCDKACGSDYYDQQRQDLIKMYEAKIEELIQSRDAEAHQIKITNADRIEALLQKLADCNTRYADLVPDYEQAKDRIRELEKQLEDLQQKLDETEDKQNKMYLHMYQQGQEAERLTHADRVLQFAKQTTNRVSVPELMQQLQVTQNELENIKDTNYVQESGGSTALLSAKEAISLWLLGARKTMYRRLIDAQQSKNKVDPEITLQFLKSAVYYFLTDKENTQGHLNAIESILGFSDTERLNIDKARAAK